MANTCLIKSRRQICQEIIDVKFYRETDYIHGLCIGTRHPALQHHLTQVSDMIGMFDKNLLSLKVSIGKPLLYVKNILTTKYGVNGVYCHLMSCIFGEVDELCVKGRSD